MSGGLNFLRCDFGGANFRDAVITDVDFGKRSDRQCTGLTTDQIKSTWNYKHDRMEGIRLPKDIAVALETERKAKKKSAEKVE